MLYCHLKWTWRKSNVLQIPKFEGWKIAKAVTEVKNEIKDAEQGRDVVMSDVSKLCVSP